MLNLNLGHYMYIISFHKKSLQVLVKDNLSMFHARKKLEMTVELPDKDFYFIIFKVRKIAYITIG